MGDGEKLLTHSNSALKVLLGLDIFPRVPKKKLNFVDQCYCLTSVHLDATINIHIRTLYSVNIKFFLMLERRHESSFGLLPTLCVTSPRNLPTLGTDNGSYSSPKLKQWLRRSRSFPFNGYVVGVEGGGGGRFSRK